MGRSSRSRYLVTTALVAGTGLLLVAGDSVPVWMGWSLTGLASLAFVLTLLRVPGTPQG